MCHCNKMPIDDEYKYVLKYIDGDHIATSEFSAFITIEELDTHLKDFLCSAGWHEETVNRIINEGE